MTSKLLLAATLLAASSISATHAPLNTPITGDYVECRTAAVFAGPCHWAGEMVTTGNDAVLAWHFTAGTYNGVSLAGVNAMASVTSDENLANNHPRQSQLVVDSAASDEQVAAFTALVRRNCTLGQVIATTRAPITFVHDSGFAVSAAGFADFTVEAMPDRACCKQPNLVWYAPMTPLTDRRVGCTQSATYSGLAGNPWHHEDENSAFYGSFRYEVR